jgi:hypothetical protein
MTYRTSNILFGGYVTGTLTYIIGNAYLDSKRMVDKWRNNQLDDYDKKRFQTEFEAAQYGIFYNIPLHLTMSFVWPLATPLMLIPYIITNKNK